MELDSQYRVNSDASSHLCFFAQGGQNTGAYPVNVGQDQCAVAKANPRGNADLEIDCFILSVLYILIHAYSPTSLQKLFIYQVTERYRIGSRRLGAWGKILYKQMVVNGPNKCQGKECGMIPNSETGDGAYPS